MQRRAGPALVKWRKRRYARVRAQHAARDLMAGLWAWLGSADTATRSKIHVATGRQDRFIDVHRLLAALLPADQAPETPGGHD